MFGILKGTVILKQKTFMVFILCVSLLLFGCGGGDKKQAGDIEVSLAHAVEKLPDGKFKVIGTTNLADDFLLTVALSNQEVYKTEVLRLPPHTGGERMTNKQIEDMLKNSYRVEKRKSVKNGKFEVVFSGKNLKPGKYELSISSSAMKNQPKKIIEIYGAEGEKLKGKFVKNGTLRSNMVWYEKTVVLK